jgi:hypothetical protein
MKYIILCFLLSSSLVLNAQASTRQIDWGPILKNKSSSYKFLGLTGDTYQMVFNPERENRLITHSLDHRIISDEDFDYVYNKQRLKIHGSIETKSGLYVYMHQFNKKYNEWILHASEFKNGTYTEPQEIYFQEIDFEKSSLKRAFDYYDDQGRNGSFSSGVDGGLSISEDSTKVAFINHIDNPKPGKQDAFAIAVFDDKMNLLWKDVFYHSFGKEDGTVTQKIVTNDGEIYLLAKVDKENKLGGKVKSRKSKNLPDFDYHICHINQEGILEHTVEIGAGFGAADMGIFFPKDNTEQYLLAGFYSNDDFGRNRINGVFFSYGDKNFNKSEVKIHEFEKDFLENLTRDRAIEKGKGVQANFAIKDMLEYKDGTIGFIAEETYETQNSFGNGMGFGNGVGLGNRNNFQNQRRTFSYHTNNIIIPKFDVEGNLLNIQKIVKEYNSEWPTTTSYSLAINKGKAYIIFNDFKKRKEAKAMNKKGRLFTDLVVIGVDGEIENRETLFSNKEIDLYFNTVFSGYNDKVMLIGTASSRNYQMGTLRFD